MSEETESGRDGSESEYEWNFPETNCGLISFGEDILTFGFQSLNVL